jgi:hypothetical protein
VPVAQRGQAEGTVVARVGRVADAHQGLGHHRHHDRQYLLAREAGQAQVLAQAPTQPGQGRTELHDPVVLALAAGLDPARVVAVLLAPARIAAGGLQVTARVHADPHLGVGRRNGQRADARQGRRIAHRMALPIAVAEPLARAPARVARIGIGDVDQAGLPGDVGGFRRRWGLGASASRSGGADGSDHVAARCRAPHEAPVKRCQVGRHAG